MGARGGARGCRKEAPSLARARGVAGGGGANDGGAGGWKGGGGGRGRGRGDGSGGASRARPMTAISLDKFARAKTSTYDKRAVLEKRRNLEAGKVLQSYVIAGTGTFLQAFLKHKTLHFFNV